MRVFDIVSAFQVKDGSDNTLEKDQENLMHIFRRLIFNHTPEVNHDIEGNLCKTLGGSDITEVEFAEMIRNLNPGEDLVVVWSYFRNFDMCPSSGYATARKAREAVTSAFKLECGLFPLGHHQVKAVAKAVETVWEGCDSEFDADLKITITRKV